MTIRPAVQRALAHTIGELVVRTRTATLPGHVRRGINGVLAINAKLPGNRRITCALGVRVTRADEHRPPRHDPQPDAERVARRHAARALELVLQGKRAQAVNAAADALSVWTEHGLQPDPRCQALAAHTN